MTVPFSVRAEDPTNIGRVDAVFETQTRVFIMEFTIGSEKDALEQIKEMKYYEKYLSSGKEIVLVGIGFHPEQRNIGSYVQEKWSYRQGNGFADQKMEL